MSIESNGIAWQELEEFSAGEDDHGAGIDGFKEENETPSARSSHNMVDPQPPGPD